MVKFPRLRFWGKQVETNNLILDFGDKGGLRSNVTRGHCEKGAPQLDILRRVAPILLRNDRERGRGRRFGFMGAANLHRAA